MRIALFGAGMQAQAIAHDIVKNPELEQLTIADIDPAQATKLAKKLRTAKALAVGANATDARQVDKAIAGHQAVIGATTYSHNILLTERAIAAGAHFCDLGGNVDVVAAQHKLGAAARKAGVTVIPDCGLAPGMVNILAYSWAQQFEAVDTLRIRVGGLPQAPANQLNYQLVFSVDGLINEYIEDCEVLRDGKKAMVPGMSGVESLKFAKPYDKLEAFYTSGGASTLPRTLKGHVTHLDYKTIRYPGHARYIQLMLDLGLFSSDTVQLGGTAIAPRKLTARLLQRYLPVQQPDVVLIRVELEGRMNNRATRVRYDCVDHFDTKTKLTAMQRTTGFPIAIIAQQLAAGRVAKTGTVPQELAIEGTSFLAALTTRGIKFRKGVSSYAPTAL